jgi:hypothetical protein
VSGGQAGADRAALDFAIERGIPRAGWCPRGRKAEGPAIDSGYHSTKAGHLIGLPSRAGFQEIGGGKDLAALAHAATARYGRQYQTLFARGKAVGDDRGRGQDHLPSARSPAWHTRF